MGYPFITINWISTIIALVALGIASYTDLKTREVPDWLSYGLVITGVAMNGIFSVALGNASFILHSLLGFGIFFRDIVRVIGRDRGNAVLLGDSEQDFIYFYLLRDFRMRLDFQVKVFVPEQGLVLSDERDCAVNVAREDHLRNFSLQTA